MKTLTVALLVVIGGIWYLISETSLPKMKETSKPVVETSKPVVETSKPVVETPKPVVETPKPVVETSPADQVIVPTKKELACKEKDFQRLVVILDDPVITLETRVRVDAVKDAFGIVKNEAEILKKLQAERKTASTDLNGLRTKDEMIGWKYVRDPDGTCNPMPAPRGGSPVKYIYAKTTKKDIKLAEMDRAIFEQQRLVATSNDKLNQAVKDWNDYQIKTRQTLKESK